MGELLTSRQNPLAKYIRKLAGQRSDRRAAGEYLADGEKLYREALLWKAPVRRVLATPNMVPQIPEGAQLTVVSEDLMAYLSPMETPQGILFTVSLPPAEELPREGKRFLALDRLQDPGNVGTIWRTADALGADGVFLLNHCADPFSPKTVRASMGACFRLPVWEVTGERLASCMKALGLPIYAAALAADSVELGQEPLKQGAVIIGNEGQGISPEVLALCEKTVKIPMRARCESLNAAAAAAVILWEMARG